MTRVRPCRRLHPALHIGHEPHGLLAGAGVDDVLQAVKSPAANKQDVGSVYLDKFLLGMLPAAFGRNRSHRAFNNFQQRLLDALSGNIPGNGRTVAFAGDFIDFVNIHNPAAGLFDIIVRNLQEVQDNILNVFADIAGFSKGGGISNRERDILKFWPGSGPAGFYRNRWDRSAEYCFFAVPPRPFPPWS